MAWTEQKPNGNFHIVFRIGESRFRRSLKTKDAKEADARRARVDENLRLVESGRLLVPEDADLVTFLLSDGKLNGKLETRKRLSLGRLFQTYEASLPAGSLEAGSLRIAAIHMRHFVRTLGSRVDLRTISLEHLQRHINARSKEPGKNGRLISAGTLKKEIATFRAIWNWARGHRYVGKAFPNRGLVFPKMDEKPPFQTWDEIHREISEGNLSAGEQRERWEALYLRSTEIRQILSDVQDNAQYSFLYPMVCVAAYAGVRRSELCRSQTADVDLRNGMLLVREKKRNRAKRTLRRVPIAPPLQSVLAEWLRQKPESAHLFPSEHKCVRKRSRPENEGAVTPQEARHHLTQVLSKTKWRFIAGWHVFRHSFISNCASLGIDQRMIDDWVGHQTDEQRRRYRHLFPDAQSEAISRVFQ